MKIEIKTPIWKSRSVGIAEEKITEDIEVEILYTNQYGERIYPGVYTMTKKLALAHPLQIVKGRRLRIIPIREFKVREKPIQRQTELETKRERPVFGDTKLIHDMKWKR